MVVTVKGPQNTRPRTSSASVSVAPAFKFYAVVYRKELSFASRKPTGRCNDLQGAVSVSISSLAQLLIYVFVSNVRYQRPRLCYKSTDKLYMYVWWTFLKIQGRSEIRDAITELHTSIFPARAHARKFFTNSARRY